MASRQRSFFEQDHSKKVPPYWNGSNKNKSTPQVRLPDSVTNRAPIAASKETKSKLQAFQMEILSNSEKENIDYRVSPEKQVEKTISRVEIQDYLPPSTPAVRLPLSELLGQSEEWSKHAFQKEPSPEEQLTWMPSMSQLAKTPAHYRKRAHSSSPMHASQHDTSVKKPLTYEQMQIALKTPNADPATDLWAKYAGTSDALGGPGTKLPSLAHLIDDCSPQSVPRSPGGGLGGLRRWASCGTEWPASKRKRRKVNGVPSLVNHNTVSETSVISKLGAMIDQVTATNDSVNDKAEINADSCVSATVKSTKQPNVPSDTTRGGIIYQEKNTGFGQVDQPPNIQALPSQSSDYGDDDIDMSGIIAIETGCDPVRQDSNKSSDTTAVPSQPHRLPTIEEDSDDFGDDTFTADDFENAISQAKKPQESEFDSNIPEKINNVSRNDQRLQTANVDFDDDFGDVDVDDEQFAAAEMAATQAISQHSTSITNPKNRTIQRYLVKKVDECDYKTDGGRVLPEKVILVEDEQKRSVRTITLRESWLDTHCNPGAYVHVVGKFSKSNHIIIDDESNLLIVHPDHLVSATAVADSFDCLRKAVLQDRVKATNATSKATVYGSLLHELFQIALQQNRWDLTYLVGLVNELVIKYIEGLFEAGAKDTVEAVEFLTSKMPELRDWAGQFVQDMPTGTSKALDRNGKTIDLCVTKLLDVEEHVWSPTYGLKGNIDATVEIALNDEEGLRRLVVPFEVKTGKHQSAAHRAQTALYTLLLSDRYDLNVYYGILYYMETSSVTRIPAIRHELRHMVMQRNELASYVRERLSLPPMLKNEFKCTRCYAKTSCMLYHKLSEDGTAATAGVGSHFDKMVSKLKPVHQDFFKNWDELLTKEETEMFKFRRELWTMLSGEREKLGRCFAEVVIEPGSAHEDREAQKINRFTYTLIRKDQNNVPFTESQIVLGEPIVISSEEGHFALANGYVTKVSRHRIGVAVDRRLHNARVRQNGFDADNNQSFGAIMEVGKPTINQETIDMSTQDQQVVYRLDKDEFSNGMATVRNNLLAIMDEQVYRSQGLRELIIENQTPVFEPCPTNYVLNGPAGEMQINSDQRAAIDKVMSAKDYTLVLGMPGTGKTTTIAHIIRALVAKGKSVLLTSYTHTAVDNILLKLGDSSISVLRLGVMAKIHPNVQQYATTPRHSIAELEEMYMTPQVVATTCLGISHQIFHKRIFDYCIVDEASQITLPICLGPIRMARTFILVGDHNQLPPLVQNKEAQQGGLDISLFKLLSDRQPMSVINLEHQYRMCADIMRLSNALIYDGRLKCGNDSVAQRTLQLPEPASLSAFHTSTATSFSKCKSISHCQLSQLVDPKNKVVFANTDTLLLPPFSNESKPPYETLVGSRITNQLECNLVVLLASAFLSEGVPPSEIGIITFYRSQLSLLRRSFRTTSSYFSSSSPPSSSTKLNHQLAQLCNIEMHTADKFQGRDKEIIILSCVRSNSQNNVGELLKDWRRTNVAITRARSKFLIVGSKSTLEKGDQLWEKLIREVEGMNGVLDLKKEILLGHGIKGMEFSWEDEVRSPVKKKSPIKGSKHSIERNGEKKMARQGRISEKVMFAGRPVSRDIVDMIEEE